MKWTQYQLTLSLLRQEHIETVRYWRNHPIISRYMEFREPITPQMQAKWFAGINNAYNFYFLINHQNEQVGLISTSGIDTAYQTGNCGIFIWQPQAVGSHVPVFAVLAMLNFNFHLLQLQSTQIKVHHHNKKAIRYNHALGYRLMPPEQQPPTPFQHFRLTRQHYFTHTLRLRQLGNKLYGTHSILQLSSTPQGEKVRSLLLNLPDETIHTLNLQII